MSVSGESLNLISHEFEEHVLSDETNNITKKLDFVINRGITLSDISYEYPDSKIFSLNKCPSNGNCRSSPCKTTNTYTF